MTEAPKAFVAPAVHALAAAEYDATTIAMWNPLVIPMAFQTGAYTRHLLAITPLGQQTEAAVDAYSAHHEARKKVLLNGHCTLHAIVGAEALHRLAALPGDVARGQIVHLLVLMRQFTFQVFPFDQTHQGRAPFMLTDFPKAGTRKTTVYLEGDAEGFVDDPEAVCGYAARIRHLSALALEPFESAEFVQDLLRQYPTTEGSTFS